MEDSPFWYWLQRHGVVEGVEYKGCQRIASVIGRFNIPDRNDRSTMHLTWLRAHLLDSETYQSMAHSEVRRNELSGDPIKLHKGLDLIEFAVTAIELDQGL